MLAPEHPDLSGDILTHTLYSSAVGDTYLLHVRLPPGYDALRETPYPVIFQLDANLSFLDQFNVTAGFVSAKEKSGAIPPTIVVGIDYPPDPGPYTGRFRDFTVPAIHDSTTFKGGGAYEFYSFIRNELVPFIDGKYSIAGPGGRALFGHSLGGLFTLFFFLQPDSARPIGGFVAASPSIWYDGGSLYRQLDSLEQWKDRIDGILHTTMGDLETPAMVVYFNDFIARLKSYGIANISSVLYNTDHLGTISPSYSNGITSLFDNGFGGGK